MDATIRATCPKCQSTLKIPAQWAGQAVKCKKCGAVVRTKSPAATPPAPNPGMGTTGMPVPSYGIASVPSPFDDLAPPAPAPVVRYNPFDSAPHVPPVAQPVQPPYPYPVPAHPGAAYPYPVAPGYPQPAGYDPAQVAAHPPATYPVPGSSAPTYPPPQPRGVPVPAQTGGDFAPSEATSSHRGRGQYRRGSGNAKYIWIGVCLFLTIGLALGGIFGTKFIKKKLEDLNTASQGHGSHEEPRSTQSGQSGGQPGTTTPREKGLLAGAGPFPRRLLFIHVSNYLYLNPLTNASIDGKSKGPDLTKPTAIRLGYEWRIPREKDNDQLFVVSDTASPPDARTPMKGVITGTYEKFFDTSRAQDRIIVYFGGHVLSRKKDDKDVTYLVPIEGDPDDEATLIPLDDFYEKLKACKATQKVVIWDVCRFNPERGRVRPGSEPMSEEVGKALAAAPAGVQAVLTCQPGENALEFFNETPDGPTKPSIAGSNFLAAIKYTAEKNSKGGAKNLGPNDPLPVDEWTNTLARRAAEVAKGADKLKQTVKVAGAAPESLVAFKADDPPASRFEFPSVPKGASAAEIGELVSEFSLPPLKKDEGESGVSGYPFPAEAIAPFKSDVPLSEIMNPENREKYLFRVTSLEAFKTIREVWNPPGGDGPKLREALTEKITDAFKKEIIKEQEFPARGIAKLEDILTRLEAVDPTKADQPKRWQVHHEYAMAQCKMRIAYLQEYNLALGNIKTETLPALDAKKGQTGYKLVSSETMKAKKEKKLADEAQEIFQKLATDYKGSPWAIQAKQDRAQSLGLAWQPFNPAAADSKDP
ncbi:MAG: hypothetical protein JWO38_1071 [Gemmataceae bacterium]|nr:hypothetical protein [Gemmataceae bacterium]